VVGESGTPRLSVAVRERGRSSALAPFELAVVDGGMRANLVEKLCDDGRGARKCHLRGGEAAASVARPAMLDRGSWRRCSSSRARRNEARTVGVDETVIARVGTAEDASTARPSMKPDRSDLSGARRVAVW
jgi:hypothetical protein